MPSEPKTKELIRPLPADWWLKKPGYLQFMLRDATAIFIAGYCIFLLFVMCAARHSPAEFAAHYAKWGSGLSKVLHLLALVAAVYHSVTFFNLTPQVLVVFRGEEKVPGHLIAVGHYVLWAVVSLVIIWIGMRM